MTIATLNNNQERAWFFSSPRKHIVSGLLSLLLIFSISFIPQHALAKKSKGNFYPNKYAAFVMDAETGLILHQKNANKSLHPASLTKLMTLLMVFDALDRGKLKLYSRVRISKHAASMIPSKLNIPPGSSIKVEDAIYALVTKSANDVAVALAEKLGGSERNFALMMNKKAKEIGMTKTRFRNASGLHDPRQVSSARDMARLARILLTKYEKHYHYFSTQKFTYQGKTYKSHNKLMQTYAGMDGMKTGYIKASGFNLVSSTIRNDRRLIGVVFGGRTGKLRNAQMEKLLDAAFVKINNLHIAKQNIPIPQKKPDRVIELASIEPAALKTLPEIEEIPQKPKSRWDMLDSSQDNSMFNRMIGQGDYDITVRNRIETGLIAISAVTANSRIPDSNNEKTLTLASNNIENNKIENNKSDVGLWSIQIGAFTSRERTDKAIVTSLEALPTKLKRDNSIIAPIKTAQGWIYRGRIVGYTKASANGACRLLDDCIPISPQITN